MAAGLAQPAQRQHHRSSSSSSRPGTRTRTTIRRRWAEEDDLAQGEWTQDDTPFDEHRWHDALETYRPFLPYSELGTVLDAQPEDLYEALHRLLGLEAITEAQQSLAEHRKRLAEIVARPYDRRERVRAELAASPDERARRAAELLGSDSPDLDAIADLALGADVGSGTNLLHQLVDLALPPDDEIERCREKLDLALGAVTVVATENAQDSLRCSEILRLAIQLQESGGNQSCPVCDLGRLDGLWHAKAKERAEHLAKAAAELAEAADRLDMAVAATRALCQPAPDVLREAQGMLDATSVLQAWQAWEDCVAIDDPVRLRSELFDRYAELVAAVDQLKSVAREQIDRRDLVWRPMAIALFEWHSQAQQALADAEVLADVTEAENWIRKTAATLRSERIAPFAKESQRIWQRLRQQSNVDLGAVRLGGDAQRRAGRLGRRRVELGAGGDEPGRAALAGTRVVPAARDGRREPVPVRGDRRPGAGDGPVQGGRSGAGARRRRAHPPGRGLHARRTAGGGAAPVAAERRPCGRSAAARNPLCGCGCPTTRSAGA